MFYKLPVLVYEENECVKKHHAEMASFGSNALIVTGKSSAKKCGALQDVQEALAAQGITSVIYDKVEENPSIETIMDARTFGLEQKVDFVIGIGGGSPLDAAKAIAVMIANADKEESFLYEKVNNVSALKVIAIPTTCGTGSEVTGVAVLTRHDKQMKASMTHKIFPKLALIDSKYLKSIPQSILCNTSIDALSHLIESFVNTNATDYSKMFAKEGLRIWAKCKKSLISDAILADDDYRNLMNASTIAGMAIAHTGTSLPHGISYYFTYELGVPHGKAVAYALAGYLEEAPTEMKQEVLDLCGFKDCKEMQSYLNEVCQLEALPDALVEKAILGILSNEAKLANCPYSVTESVLRKMVQ